MKNTLTNNNPAAMPASVCGKITPAAELEAVATGNNTSDIELIGLIVLMLARISARKDISTKCLRSVYRHVNRLYCTDGRES